MCQVFFLVSELVENFAGQNNGHSCGHPPAATLWQLNTIDKPPYIIIEVAIKQKCYTEV